MKRIQLSASDLPPSDPGGPTVSPEFGRSMIVPAGLPPCSGHGGIGACGYTPDSAVARGDLDGGGAPDIVVGAPGYSETGETNPPPRCDQPDPAACPDLGCKVAEPGVCRESGRVFVFRGEAIQSNPGATLDTPLLMVKWFGAFGAGNPPRFGRWLAALGDVGKCDVPDDFPATDARCLNSAPPNAPNSQPDGSGDLLITVPGDDTGAQDAGGAFVIDGRRGAAIRALHAASADASGGFGSVVAGAPAGDMAADLAPDVFVASPALAPGSPGPGAGFVFDGNVSSGSLLWTLGDPSAASGGGFGASYTGLGNVVSDAAAEIAVGDPRGDGIGEVHIFNACKQALLQTISDPNAQAGSRFGSALVPLGDVNADGFLDLAVSAPGFDGLGADQGAVYLMRSTGAGGPGVDACRPVPPAGGGGGGGGAQPGGSSGSGGGGTSSPRARLAARTVRITLSKRRILRQGRLLRLRGTVRSTKRKKACQVRQKVAVQRRRPGSKFFQTFDVAITKADGSFDLKIYPFTTYAYRARVSQTSRCTSAVSKAWKVSVRTATDERNGIR
jgi:hypothetical protein